MEVCLLWMLSVVQVEIPTSGRSLVQRSPTKCGVSESDHAASIMRRPWPTKGCLFNDAIIVASRTS
jgi:hypothetical protein